MSFGVYRWDGDSVNVVAVYDSAVSAGMKIAALLNDGFRVEACPIADPQPEVEVPEPEPSCVYLSESGDYHYPILCAKDDRYAKRSDCKRCSHKRAGEEPDD